MTIDYKHKFFIYHPDGKFTEAQIKEMLDAAYKAGRDEGYNDGYNAGKMQISWVKPYWWDTSLIPYCQTNSDTTGSTLSSVTTTATSDINNNKTYTISNTAKLTNEEINNTLGIKNPKTLEFRYNGTER